MVSTTLLTLSALPLLASAHFQLTWPKARGFDDTTAGQYPCGGFNTVNTTRAAIPLTGTFPLQLNMEHTSVRGQVVLAVGNNPSGNDFKTIVRQTFSQTGPNNFCIGGLTIPSAANVTAGTNGTLLVITNGDPNGGLYQCVDVTFTNEALSSADYSAHCVNSTGVSASIVGGSSPNGTAGTATSAASGAASATSKAWAAQATVGSILLGAAGLLGGFAAL